MERKKEIESKKPKERGRKKEQRENESQQKYFVAGVFRCYHVRAFIFREKPSRRVVLDFPPGDFFFHLILNFLIEFKPIS